MVTYLDISEVVLTNRADSKPRNLIMRAELRTDLDEIKVEGRRSETTAELGSKTTLHKMKRLQTRVC